MRMRSRVLAAAVALTITALLAATSSVAAAAVGSVLRSLSPTPSGNGRALAFDSATRHLYYTNKGYPQIYVHDDATSGPPIRTLNPTDRGSPIYYGALSWQATPTGGVLWGGRYDGSGRVDKIDPNTGAVTPMFSFAFPAFDSCYGPFDSGYIDGLAFDPGDGTLWLGDDAASDFFKVRTDGTLIGAYQVPSGLCRSGIAVDSGFLWLGLQAGPDQAPYQLGRVAKSDTSMLLQSIDVGTNGGPEGLAMDYTTFGGQCALWSSQFGFNTVLTARELPAGLCHGLPSLGLQRQVIDAFAGQSFSQAVLAVSDTSRSNRGFTATINWGDGTSPSRGLVVSLVFSNYCSNEQLPAGTCYAVYGAHTYRAFGLYRPTVTLTEGANLIGATDIADVQPDPGAPNQAGIIAALDPSTGYVDWGGTGCSATVLANTDIVLTANHCGPGGPGLWAPGYVWEFSPTHTGQCANGQTAICPDNPDGVFYTTSASAVQVGTSDIELVTFPNPNEYGRLLSSYPFAGEVPVFSASPTDTWTSYGHAVRSLDFSPRSCGPTAGTPSAIPATILLPGCTYGVSNGNFGGVSGAPWLDNSSAPVGVGAVEHGFCLTFPPGCVQSTSLQEPYAYATILGVNAMDTFVQLALEP